MLRHWCILRSEAREASGDEKVEDEQEPEGEDLGSEVSLELIFCITNILITIIFRNTIVKKIVMMEEQGSARRKTDMVGLSLTKLKLMMK